MYYCTCFSENKGGCFFIRVRVDVFIRDQGMVEEFYQRARVDVFYV